MKILIVEDEYFSRQGIQKFITDMDCGFEIFMADNGYDGMELTRKHNIEIIITDIRMPQLSGLEMIEQLKQEGYSFEFVIISGHDDFAYAQKALKMGATDFILKPVSPEELTNSINMILEKNEKNRQMQQNYVERHLLRVLNGDDVASGIINNFFSEKPLFLFVCDLKEDENSSGLEISTFHHNLKNALGGSSFIYVSPQPNRHVILGDYGDESMKNTIKEFTQNKAYNILPAFYQPVSDGLVYTAYTEISGWLKHWLYLKNGKILLSSPKPKVPFSEDGLNAKLRKMRLAIRGGYRSNMLKESDALFAYFTDTLMSYSNVNRTLISLRVFTREYLTNNGYPSANLTDPQYQVLPSLEKLKSDFSDFLIETASIITSKPSEGQNAVQEALFYIQNHFDKDISLNQIAKDVHLNPSYLSRKIKDETNLGFSKYLLQLRMEKSIELLRGDYTIQEVAKAVGYNDYRQFSSQFKDYTGESPSRYRNQN